MTMGINGSKVEEQSLLVGKGKGISALRSSPLVKADKAAVTETPSLDVTPAGGAPENSKVYFTSTM